MLFTQEMNLTRYLNAQNQLYLTALAEVRAGQKQTHWMWFIFPQLKGPGRSETANYYAIKNLDEAIAYLAHPVLGKHLVEITSALSTLRENNATAIFGSPDDLKLCSSMTLFANASGAHPVFGKVIDKYFQGRQDERTLALLATDKV